MTQPDATSGMQHHTLDWHDGDMPYSREFGDHFYCREDGRAECSHVFVGANGLPERWAEKRSFTVAELGFGTGLNLCETWRQWKTERQTGSHLAFHSFEMFPMKGHDIDRALARWPELDTERARLVALWPDAPAGIMVLDLDAMTRLIVHCGDANLLLDGFAGPVDAWYLDGFAPSRNRDLWSEDLMCKVFARTAPGGSFATYAAAGFVRRNLQAAGFLVDRRRGYGSKREMLCGHRPAG